MGKKPRVRQQAMKENPKNKRRNIYREMVNDGGFKFFIQEDRSEARAGGG